MHLALHGHRRRILFCNFSIQQDEDNSLILLTVLAVPLRFMFVPASAANEDKPLLNCYHCFLGCQGERHSHQHVGNASTGQ
jgi:hypothetical protein